MLLQFGLFIPIVAVWAWNLGWGAKFFFKKTFSLRYSDSDTMDVFVTQVGMGVLVAGIGSFILVAAFGAEAYAFRHLYLAPLGVVLTLDLLGRFWESRAGEGVRTLPVPRLTDTYTRYVQRFCRFVPWPAALVFMLVWWQYPEVFINWAGVGISVTLAGALPCVMRLGAPAAIAAGTKQGEEQGIFFKNPALLENAHKIDVIVIEKTGIITENRAVVTDLIPETGVEKLGLLRLAASVAGVSDHDVLRAIVNRAREERLSPELADRRASYPGPGACANIGSKIYHLGDSALLKELKIPINGMLALEAYRLEAEGKIPVFLAEDGKPIGIIAVAEALRKNSAAAIRNLIAFGPDIIMVTEDAPRPAARVASLVGITQFIANASPEEKIRQIKRFQEQGKRVAMIGNSANDASALALADIGIAIGEHAVTPAKESADIIIETSDIEQLPAALALCRATERNVRQNLGLAFAVGMACAVIAISYAYITGVPLLNPAITLAAIFLAAGAMLLRKK